ncbi:hypothetical protein [Scandinavium goeteborgense]|uniref:hypothetical protein n=1 Tax=Scandinavium goeteborgense TaxID=1851514 RepID=UPI000F65A9FA|nr:hypothetical protein [Scandinavium goeteborgense]QKN82080.1 hypothetical protein A8O29_012575 [Scandinavium goeteborgense]
MAYRYFELTENIPFEEEKELHAQFRHHLEHVVKAMFMPDSRGKHIVVSGRDEDSITAIFGGPDEKFIHLYHIDEYEKI